MASYKAEPMNKDEQVLLEGAQRFDLETLAEIYDRYSSGLFQYAVRLLGESGLAEECVAETFLRFLKALRAGQGPKNYLQAYLYRIAHHWISDYYRRQPPPPLELEEDSHILKGDRPDDQMESSLLREELRAALTRLTPEQRQVIMLRFIEGWENEAVAATLQKPVGAIKALQHRALASLRRILQYDKERVKDE